MIKWNQQLHFVLKDFITPQSFIISNVQNVSIEDIKLCKSISLHDTKKSNHNHHRDKYVKENIKHDNNYNNKFKDKHNTSKNIKNNKSNSNSSSNIKYSSSTTATEFNITIIDIATIYPSLYHIVHHTGLNLLFNLSCYLSELIISLPSEYLQLMNIIFIALLQSQLPTTAQQPLIQQVIHIIIKGNN